MKKQLLTFVVMCCTFLTYGQQCCDMDTEMIICYTSENDFCQSDCRYTFDGDFMQGLRNKITNPSNYGLNGIVDCELTTVPIPNLSTVPEIEDLQCDLIFIGNFAESSSGGMGTSIDDSFFAAVLAWSVKCPQNLVVAFQGEAEKWGYEIQGDNVNPNTKGSVSTPNIFDGPFGSLTFFNQGGSFQANFSQLNPNGTTVLAEDNSGRPTIVLDQTTNDILLADVGIVCNTAGSVSMGPNVINDNDALACNLFALGCSIASADIQTSEDVFICENTTFELADGVIVDQEGVYQATVLSEALCDSTITTTLMFSIPDPGQVTYKGCDGDGYSIMVGNELFNQEKPSGQVIVPNQYGCDSMISIQLDYESHTFGSFDTIICTEDSFILHGLFVDTAVDTQVVIMNTEGCDSTIAVFVEQYEVDPYILDNNLTIFNNRAYEFQHEMNALYTVEWSPSTGLSCTDCLNPIINNEDYIGKYIMTITTDMGCILTEDINIKYSCQPYLPDMFNPNSQVGNDRFGPLAPCMLQNYSIHIYDRWGTEVFTSEDPLDHWNGKLKGNRVVSGVYFYKIQFDDLEEPQEIIGGITMIQ